MHQDRHIDRDTLLAEIARHLAVVDAFRAAGSEPSWRPEIRPSALGARGKTSPTSVERSAH
jgi:hypothetical protein